ncbi:hypothetical protein BDR04DRAFT_1153893 [Suillus decipiens]|nr:hypothetical protein BDR04DRAFT_1153893 [Suillus decipiens]
MAPTNQDEYTQLNLQEKILTLGLNLIVMLCIESIGFVHGISLRSALASERRLRFNTNLRLLTAAGRWYNPNGALLNVISTVLIIISYSSASFIICLNARYTPPSPIESGPAQVVYEEHIAFVGIPLLILGVALLLQVIIALSGIWSVKILTWSSSSFDLTAALVHHTQLTPATFRCMRCVSDLDTDKGPVKPSEIQPSAWRVHPSIRKIVISLWGTIAAFAGLAALATYMPDIRPPSDMVIIYGNPLDTDTWTFLPNTMFPSITLTMWDGTGMLQAWIVFFVIIAVIQGPLTLGLHLSELIANVVRDERQWRCATGGKGLIMATNPVKTIFNDPICLVLFIVKPFLHWMFGLAFTIYNTAVHGQIGPPEVYIFTGQIYNLCIALFIFACLFTFVALHRPRGPQPAAYGHVQTLANLVDKWSPVMWWGHKEDGILYCHAGTSDHPLPDVNMDRVYAGSGAGSLAPLVIGTF